jgi:NAD(P)-dependent dehydrogenase (short-subunit alcohol dehydrogenase family)
MSGLRGKTIVMSGGSRGIGRAIALRLPSTRCGPERSSRPPRSGTCSAATPRWRIRAGRRSSHHILIRPARTTTGNFFIDDEVLTEAGVTDLSAYAYVADAELQVDLFLDG